MDDLYKNLRYLAITKKRSTGIVLLLAFSILVYYNFLSGTGESKSMFLKSDELNEK